ncbi:MAG: ferric reductase-like transmembrane domain-containing protein [Gemmatimonadaceae bacterium]|nr:ferric reductase-like transmembrane domain-containing protein [Gemmatimonadaceae bacterium]
MQHIARVWWAILTIVTIVWLAADAGGAQRFTMIEWRNVLVQYSGLLAVAWMSAGVILATRPRWPERWLGGLDKMYRLHKWVGISALVLSVLHWVSAKGPKWATTLGMMERGPRAPRAVPTNVIERGFLDYRGPAEAIGEWAFYAVVVLSVVSLVKWFPYRAFYQSHRLFALVYLALCFHAIILTNFVYWTSPVAVVLAPTLAWGVWAALRLIFRRVGVDRQAEGTITALEYYPGVHALEVVLDVPHGWRGHTPGQFAFVRSNRWEGAHPYTMASAWDMGTQRITFVVKALGDHTARLREKLQIGQAVRVEGPYGCFTFDGDETRQIWVGGGVGITPFIARMKFLAAQGPQAHVAVDLFHASADEDAKAFAKLGIDADAAGVQLHISVDARNGFLSAARIRELVPDWRSSSIWFCGPTALGDALRRDFATAGMDVRGRFHQELFAMR